MFTAAELQSIDRKYFTVIVADAYDVTLISNNTRHMLLKGDGEEAEHIMYGSTLSDDQHASRQFDFMLSNPPYGKSWKTDAEKMGGNIQKWCACRQSWLS